MPAVRRARFAVPLGLVVAAAGITHWRATTRVVLWDLSYVLNHAYRIAHGDLPYRDFPLPHAPGTFLIQAALVKVAGPSYRSVVWYVVVVGASAMALTFVVVRSLLRHRRHPLLLATLLSAPLLLLGVYTLYPHPFYDADATLLMLLGIAGVLAVKRVSPTPFVAVPVGIVLVAPAFVKQNVGVAYFVLMHLALLTFLSERTREARRRWAFLVGGSVTGLVVAVASIAATVGLGRYLHWTVEYASGVRLNDPLVLLDKYRSWRVWLCVAVVVVAIALVRRTRRVVLVVTGVALLAAAPAPLIVDAWRGELYGALDAWPFAIALCCVIALPRLFVRRPTFEDVLPFVVAGVVEASLLSQGLVGSTYAIWPFLLIALATVVRVMPMPMPTPGRRLDVAPAFAAVVSLALVWSGRVYLHNDVRLRYVAREQAPRVGSTFETLAGMHEPGTVLPVLDALLRYVDETVPVGDAVVALPGEDPLFFALDRKPRFPVLTFDTTVNPYSTPQIVAMIERYDVRWIIVKEDNQFDTTVPPRLRATLTRGFLLERRLGAYRVYVRQGTGPEQLFIPEPPAAADPVALRPDATPRATMQP